MVILENVKVPESIKAKALSIDETGFDSIGQLEGKAILYAAFYTRPDQLENILYSIVEDAARDLFLYCVVFTEDGATLTRQQRAAADAEFNMREHIKVTAVLQYECPARFNKQEQIDAVADDLKRLLDADSETDVECNGFSISEHKSEAEIYSAISSIEVTLPEEQPHARNRSNELLAGLRVVYEDEIDEPRVLVKDALCDLRHICDVHGLSFSDLDKHAYVLYAEERADAANTNNEV